jgi:hypothetical protein
MIGTRIVISILALLLIFTGCDKRTYVNQTKDSDSGTSQTSNPGGGGTLPTTPGGGEAAPTDPDTNTSDGTGGSAYNFFTYPGLVVHGTRFDNDPNRIVWASNTAPSMSSLQNQLLTDSRFNIRVWAKSQQGNSTDAYGVPCNWLAWAQHTQLQMTVTVRAQGAVSGDTKIISMRVDDTSPDKHVFSTPFGTTQPLIVEVKNVKWDYSCIYDREYNDGNAAATYCPWDLVWNSQCVMFDVQVATDYTLDFPE